MTTQNPANRPRALIAMSGGVDSSVAACLMQQAGYDCTGITMRLTHNETLGQADTGCAPWSGCVRCARRCARKLPRLAPLRRSGHGSWRLTAYAAGCASWR